MIQGDLEAAGIPYVVEGADGPLYADFHALRHSFVALLDRTGATLKEAMQLARHSDPRLTMARYGRAQLEDLGQTVGRLPELLGVAPVVPPAGQRPAAGDADLARVVEAWPELPDDVRRQVLALIALPGRAMQASATRALAHKINAGGG